jgi:hypothetical protein
MRSDDPEGGRDLEKRRPLLIPFPFRERGYEWSFPSPLRRGDRGVRTFHCRVSGNRRGISLSLPDPLRSGKRGDALVREKLSRMPITRNIGFRDSIRGLYSPDLKLSNELRFPSPYASMLAYLAFFSMNSRRGGTSSPMSMEKMRSASAALSKVT